MARERADDGDGLGLVGQTIQGSGSDLDLVGRVFDDQLKRRGRLKDPGGQLHALQEPGPVSGQGAGQGQEAADYIAGGRLGPLARLQSVLWEAPLELFLHLPGPFEVLDVMVLSGQALQEVGARKVGGVERGQFLQ